jgi:hypothetical protein
MKISNERALQLLMEEPDMKDIADHFVTHLNKPPTAQVLNRLYDLRSYYNNAKPEKVLERYKRQIGFYQYLKKYPIAKITFANGVNGEVIHIDKDDSALIKMMVECIYKKLEQTYSNSSPTKGRPKNQLTITLERNARILKYLLDNGVTKKYLFLFFKDMKDKTKKEAFDKSLERALKKGRQ